MGQIAVLLLFLLVANTSRSSLPVVPLQASACKRAFHCQYGAKVGLFEADERTAEYRGLIVARKIYKINEGI
jgi:hypothetical protein